jgi:hypothetical protein
MKKMKTLCKVKKSHYGELREEVVAAVTRPLYICEKCLRVSSKKDLLCSPCAIEKWKP